MRPDPQRLCNADHRTAEESLGDAEEWLRNALEKMSSDTHRNSLEYNGKEMLAPAAAGSRKDIS